ncbi:MAG: glutaminyl-peptide cyclotransferase [candidate division WOR-3 bacterium]|nr:MAG: glutaminyl-peptide cyclotransferase [candidate division WOR-3 bacterium]
MFACCIGIAQIGRPHAKKIIGHARFQDSIPVYDYAIVNTYPHDPAAFTQGLIYHNGYLYEGTGLYGASSLRKVELATGAVIKIFHLPQMYFGEGITMYRDTILQLTWREHIGFVYEEHDVFQVVDSFSYPTEGWGLTHNDTFLIMSDGTPTLYFLDPVTYDEVYTIEVTVNGAPLMNINELEFIQGMVYANIWFHDSVAIIDPSNGMTVGWVNLKGILGDSDGATQNVLNGIAFDPHDARLFVTGKLWPELFEIEIEPVDYPPAIIRTIPSSPCSVCVDDFLTLIVDAHDPDVEDTMSYTWSVNGIVDSTFTDSFFVYAARWVTVDTVTVTVTDGDFFRSVSWQVCAVPWYFTTVDWHRFVTFEVLGYPNPCRDRCQVVFQFSQTAACSLQNIDMSVSLYSASGRILQRIGDYRLDPGVRSFPWDFSDLAGGIYFLECCTQQYRDVLKLVVLGE